MAAHSVQFTNAVTTLSSTAPVDHAHIIDIASYTSSNGNQNTNMKLQDAIATMLHNIPVGDSTALTRFLDPAQNFRLIQSFIDPGNTDKLVIAKRGNKVIVGIVTEHVAEDCFEFDNLVHFTVNPDISGIWSITYMSYRDYFHHNWDDFWARRTVDKGFGELNMQAMPGNDPFNVWDLFPFQLAAIIMSNRLWEAQTCQWSIS
ncbi:hypothetical protein BKA63DRAFT_564313 [Paraphoma chrysanthemicola]|nr:hypothetical protein BKA63DRAFT_564313 [Paraphoma chrysanthemicola]